MKNSIREGRQGEQKSDERAGSAHIEEGAAGTDGRANEDERAKGADQGRRRNKEGIAGVDVVMAAGEVMPKFVGEQNGEQRGRKRQSRYKKQRVMVSDREGFEESIGGESLVVRVGRCKIRAGQKSCQERKKKQSGRQEQRAQGRMDASGLVIGAWTLQMNPCRGMQKSGGALFCLGPVHNDLLGGRRGGVFQTLELFAGLKSHGLARRNADLFAGARVAADAGLAGLDAEDTKFAQFDALAAAERALQRLEDGLHGLFCFRAANVRFRDHRVYYVQLDHTTLQESVARC